MSSHAFSLFLPYLVPTALCPVSDNIVIQPDSTALQSDWVSNFGLGGFSFSEVFGSTPSVASFQCRRICDGTVSRKTTSDDGKQTTTYGRIDTGQCDGP